jgi:hypothetical protein
MLLMDDWVVGMVAQDVRMETNTATKHNFTQIIKFDLGEISHFLLAVKVDNGTKTLVLAVSNAKSLQYLRNIYMRE